MATCGKPRFLRNQPASYMETPVLFIIFNRPDTTARVFEAIRSAKPKYLYVAADAPRPNQPTETLACEEARKIATTVDWPCQVKTLFRKKNLGCKNAVSGAISWFFEQVEEGIILEDDCLPDPTFFPFCESMLERFRTDTRVMMVTGDNFLGEWQSDKQSYHFTSGGIWGWATWKRAWHHFDVEIKAWGTPSGQAALKNAVQITNPAQYNRICKLLNFTYHNPDKVTWWGYQWLFARYCQSGLSVAPAKNLISNIGFGQNAAHSHQVSWEANLPTAPLSFPLQHNPFVVLDKEFERREFMLSQQHRHLGQRIKNKTKQWLRTINSIIR